MTISTYSTDPTAAPRSGGLRLGIIGGGQLARMTHQAAITLGVQTTILCDDPDAPAVQAGGRHLAGRPDHFPDLLRLAASVDAVTVDHERTPSEALGRLADRGYVVAPGALAARLGQDKADVRAVLGAEGVPVAPWITGTDVDAIEAIEAFGAAHGWPLVLKRRRGGYDGRGVWQARDLDAARAVVEEAGPVVVEPYLAFAHELSVLVVRSAAGEIVAYPPVETIQRQGQCDEVFVPVLAPAPIAVQARALAVRVAELVELVGTMAVELFVVGDQLLLNELAVRPHNSGHLTIEACPTSQFENHVRAVFGLPLGATNLRVPAACMVNVIGSDDGRDPLDALGAALAVPGATVHRYGKDPRPRRKLGHITATGDDLAEARDRAARARLALTDATVPA
jgi:5-(carboxyamino)imidazole ribonucleotide synthase